MIVNMGEYGNGLNGSKQHIANPQRLAPRRLAPNDPTPHLKQPGTAGNA